MSFNDALLKTEKKVADAFGVINQATRAVLDLIDPQQKNVFEIIMTPEVPPNLRGTEGIGLAKQIALTALDTAICTFYVQNLEIPFNSLEYGRFDYLQAITDMTYADECTITFLETELSIVRMFLKNWMDLSFQRDLFHGGYIFEDNQYLARKKAIIIPQSRTGLPNTVWIEIRGMRFKSIEPFAFDQQSADPMIISCTFACDEIYLNSLF
jgi:hypothetical protein